MDNILIRMTVFNPGYAMNTKRPIPTTAYPPPNLIDYLAFRRTSPRCRTNWRASGLNSLGRSEAAIRAQINRVRTLIDGLQWHPSISTTCCWNPVQSGQRKLAINTAKLFGPTPGRQTHRIMVTLPTRREQPGIGPLHFMQAGIDVARIQLRDSA